MKSNDDLWSLTDRLSDQSPPSLELLSELKMLEAGSGRCQGDGNIIKRDKPRLGLDNRKWDLSSVTGCDQPLQSAAQCVNKTLQAAWPHLSSDDSEGPVVWPQVMKLFVSGMTLNCSATASLPCQLTEPLNRNPRSKNVDSVGSGLFRIFHSWENEILAEITKDCLCQHDISPASKILDPRLQTKILDIFLNVLL